MADSGEGVLRSAARLSLGTFLAQVLGTASQFLLVVWLTPADFGVFAIASASLILVFAMINFGEVGGFLAGQGWSPRELARVTSRVNLLLCGASLLLALAFWLNGSGMLALLIAMLALEVPLMGRTIVLYAIAVRARAVRLAVQAQVAGAVVKLAVGVGVASITGSPVALAAALVGYSVVMLIPMEIWMRRLYPLGSETRAAGRPGRARRVRWALQSLSQTLPAQADYVVVAWLGTPHMIGLYFFCYQATVGLSALVSGPLMKSSMAEFSQSASSEGGTAGAYDLLLHICRGAAVLCLGAALLVSLFHDLLPSEWRGAGPVLIMLIGSVAPRLVTPITEARQVVRGRWDSSTINNVLDGIGTAFAALSALYGSVLVLATSVAIWKFLVAALRVSVCFRNSTIRQLSLVMLWPAYALAVSGLGAWMLSYEADYVGLVLFLGFAAPAARSSYVYSRRSGGPISSAAAR